MKEKVILSDITIIDVYDNVEFDPKFKIGFGFGCVVKLKDKTILFDTGGDSPTLLSNLETARINPADIDIIFISHNHGDHAGGLQGFLKENPNVTIYEPTDFSKPTNLLGGVYSTGALGTIIKEQSLIIDSDKGLVVITGCAHPGIVNIVRKAKELMNKDVDLAMGGFHHPPVSVVKEFRELGVEKAAPSHCTGDEAIQAFEKEYKDDFIKSGVGRIIKI